EAGSIVPDDKLTTGQKAGELTDLAGGLAGAAAGGKAGAAAGAAIGSFFFGAGAIPGAAIGGLIGSVGGFFLGEKVTEGARETVFGGNDDPEAVVSPAKNEAQEKLRKKYFENDRDNYGSTAGYAL